MIIAMLFARACGVLFFRKFCNEIRTAKFFSRLMKYNYIFDIIIFKLIQISSSKWVRLKEGPSPRFNAAIAIYQSTVLIAGGTSGEGDIWGYHTEINQWLQWTKALPRQIGGASFIKNEVLYTFSEDENNSNSIFLHGFDLVDRKSQTFRHKIPVSIWTIITRVLQA